MSRSIAVRLALIFAFFLPLSLFRLLPLTHAAGEEVRGTLDNWQNAPAWTMSASLGGTFIYNSAQIPSCGAERFKFYNTVGWYGNGGTVTFGTILTGLSTTGGDINYTCTGGKFYTWKWDAGPRGVLFELSAAPVAITGVTRNPAAPGSGESVLVTATTAATPPAEQALWLRYTTDNWASSTVVKMTGAGTSYAATIPAQANGVTVQYYVFSSGNVGSIAGGDADLMTINADTNGGSNYRYTVGSANPISDAQALWVDTRVIAWNGLTTGVTQYRLLYDPDGAVVTTYGGDACSAMSALEASLRAVSAKQSPAAFASSEIASSQTPLLAMTRAENATLTGPCYVALTANGTIAANQFPKNPNANGLPRLDLPPAGSLAESTIKALLKGQVVVAAYGAGNALVDVSRVQIQGVLDALYAANAKTQTLGVTYSSAPTVKVWAPTAKAVTLRRYATSTGAEVGSHAMAEDAGSGVWSVTGDASWDRQFYLFDVQVYVPAADAVLNNLVTDPYAVSLSADGAAAGDVRSQFVNLADADLKPAGWDTLTKPSLAVPEDIVIYEVHVRDFSIHDTTVTNAADRGTYKAFTYDGTGGKPLSAGMSHLKQLQAAGLTHIHLLPVFDIASVIEKAADRVEPTIVFNPLTDRASTAPQAAISATRTTDGFNWGYDPFHYGVPEGSYSTDPDGVTRILEFREMVQALNRNGLRVVLDVVYNHLAASGQDDYSVLDKVVPGYYLRYDTNGVLANSSCCSDTASEYDMMEKLMIDTAVRFATAYKVDGFRFDLMNLHTRQNMLNLKAAVRAVDPTIYIYGEGWDFGSARDKGLTTCPNCYARQSNMTAAGIGMFNDRIRDAAHGGFSTDPLQIRHQGFINGLSYDWNGYYYNNRTQADLWYETGRLRTALAGSGADYTDDPQETINYVEKHDNETLFDQNVFKLPNGVSMANRVRSQNLGTSLVGLAQGIPFFHMGQDLLRSKSLDRNSYDSGDWFNRVNWDRSGNNFGRGLPPAWDNSTRWGIMTPLLNDTALDPAAADMDAAAAHLREILRIRKSSPLFRLTTEADANARVSFHNTDNARDGLIVMQLSDIPDPDLDAAYETILVFFNAHKIAQTYTIAGANAFSLHPLQADATDADPVVQTASFNDATDTFTIPGRTTAVFVSAQALTPPLPPSSIDWVGQMWPRGSAGTPERVNQGAFTPASFNVYVQVYEPGVTGTGGSHSGISCYLHWGRYGAVWTDLAMTRNLSFSGNPNNDEYIAQIPQATMNGLAAGTYGFTAYCQRAGEDKKWKVDSSGDWGDGLFTVVPASDPRPAPPGSVFVHLFEWTWPDIQRECPYLASKGYTGVQISPPMEHLVPAADMGDPLNDYPWWVRYQPVSYTLAQSRSGTLAEFQAMVQACNAVGVDIIADAVINHMTGPASNTTTYIGTAGTPYRGFQYPYPSETLYGPGDFHANVGACPSANGEIQDYADRRQVQYCELSGLSDLTTGAPTTQAKIRAYLQSLLDLGVKGFRIDGAKHIPAHHLAAILDGLTGDFYLFGEAIDQSASEAVRDWEYTPLGDVSEFAYPYAIGDAFDDACAGSLSQLETLGSSADFLPGRFAVVFTDNHDNQRGHGVGPGRCVVDHRDGAEHVLANIFALAYPYGDSVSVMSSYYWQPDPAVDTGDGLGPPTVLGGPGSSGATLPVHTDGDLNPDNCASTYTWGKWACEHRRTTTAHMVRFRQVTAGQAVTNWQNIGGAGSDHIAFGRGSRGFVAINRTAAGATTTYQTSMAAGTYCDVTRGELTANGTACTGRTITVDAAGRIVGQALASMDAFAIHVGQKVQAAGEPRQAWLSWAAVGGTASYRIFRQENAPYFAPAGDPLAVSLTTGFYDPDAATDSSAINHFYVIQALDAAGNVLGEAGRRGEFTFGLTPGTP